MEKADSFCWKCKNLLAGNSKQVGGKPSNGVNLFIHSPISEERPEGMLCFGFKNPASTSSTFLRLPFTGTVN